MSTKKPPSSGPATTETPNTRAEQALVAAAVARRDEVADDGHRDDEQAAAAEPLDRAERDQLRHALRQPAQRRADEEEHERELEDALAAVEVAELPVQRPDHRRRQQVGVTTQERCSRPPRSPTIVGSAVDTIVWSSDAMNSTRSSAPKIRRRWRAAVSVMVPPIGVALQQCLDVQRRGPADHSEQAAAHPEPALIDRRRRLDREPVVGRLHGGVELERLDHARHLEVALDVQHPVAGVRGRGST